MCTFVKVNVIVYVSNLKRRFFMKIFLIFSLIVGYCSFCFGETPEIRCSIEGNEHTSVAYFRHFVIGESGTALHFREGKKDHVFDAKDPFFSSTLSQTPFHCKGSKKLIEIIKKCNSEDSATDCMRKVFKK